MNGHKIIFDDTEWVNAGIGMRYKAFIHDNQRVRFVEFSDGFVEPDWCTRGHVGIVLDGSFTIDYDGSLERYSKGDIIFIPGGEASKHKAVLNKGENVTLLLFEILDSETSPE
jgi:quercetin dioxygenase-like cupin family protein